MLGEVLVRTKGFMGLLGLALMLFYFSYHVSGEALIWMATIYIIGVVMIIIDGKVLNDGTLGVLGVILMMVAVAVPAPTITYGASVIFGMASGTAASLLWLKVFPRRRMWEKIALKDRLTSEDGYNSINEGYHSLVGQEGVAVTDFRPTGTVRVQDKDYSAVSDGKWIKYGQKVKVLSVDGTRILIVLNEESAEK
ncbi:nodulation protein NfeD [Bacillaceae bacterium SIJ1]|nr:nodulation protein NfeD [Litoribacterium kuwaitense]